MGKIFYLMGKSASGKDTLFRLLMERFSYLKTVVMYSTRPIRDHEEEGREYFFVTRDYRREMEAKGKVIECRTYHTIAGPWDYFTVDDGQIDLENHDYLMTGTLVSYQKMKEYYGEEVLIPLYIDLDDGIRRERALGRERQQQIPKYKEMCRRFLADAEDFSEDNLHAAGITKRYINEDLNECLEEISSVIQSFR